MFSLKDESGRRCSVMGRNLVCDEGTREGCFAMPIHEGCTPDRTGKVWCGKGYISQTQCEAAAEGRVDAYVGGLGPDRNEWEYLCESGCLRHMQDNQIVTQKGRCKTNVFGAWVVES